MVSLNITALSVFEIEMYLVAFALGKFQFVNHAEAIIPYFLLISISKSSSLFLKSSAIQLS